MASSILDGGQSIMVMKTILQLGFITTFLSFHTWVAGFDSDEWPHRLKDRVLLGPDALDIDINVHRNQSNALRQIFEPVKVISLQRLNWDFANGPAQYCYFIGIECDKDGFITAVDLNNQGLVGPLPDHFADLTRLRQFEIYNNELSGPLPPSLLTLTSLRNLNVGHNSFSGSFPMLPASLTRVILDRNSFSGILPTSLCALQDIELLDLASLTQISGTLPDCLGSLTALTKLHLTDLGLVGLVPPSLCTEREMNGFTPNVYGCDVIACGPGFYQRPAGRQTSPESPCLKCDVPSNAIGSSSCQWHANLANTNEPNPSTALTEPSVNSSMTPRSTNPSIALTAYATKQPTSQPSIVTNQRLSIQPLSQVSNQPTISSQPTPELAEPVSVPVPTEHTIVVERAEKRNRSRLYIIAAGILIPALFCVMIPLIALKTKDRPKDVITDSTELLSPDITRSTDSFGPSSDTVISSETSTDKTKQSTGQPETKEGPTRPVYHQVETKQLSPSSYRNGRNVRFIVPETITEYPSAESLAALSCSSNEGNEQPKVSSESTLPKVNVEKTPPTQTVTSELQPIKLDSKEDLKRSSIERWFDNPMFYPLRSCHAPCLYGNEPEETSSAISPSIVDHDHEPTSPSRVGTNSPSTITMDMEMSSGDELEAVLGIRMPRSTNPSFRMTVNPLALELIQSKHITDDVYPMGRPKSLDENYHDVIDEELDVVVSTKAELESSKHHQHLNHQQQQRAGFRFRRFEQS